MGMPCTLLIPKEQAECWVDQKISRGFNIATREPLGSLEDPGTQEKVKEILVAFLKKKAQEDDFIAKARQGSSSPSSEEELLKAKEEMKAVREKYGLINVTPYGGMPYL